MKKLFLLVFIMILTVLVGCSFDKDYTTRMIELEEPEKVTLVTFLLEESVWVTHEYQLNEEETLYYAPEKVKVGLNTYLNDEEMFFILKTESTLLELNYEIVDQEKLKTIFEE